MTGYYLSVTKLKKKKLFGGVKIFVNLWFVRVQREHFILVHYLLF